ncbi:hypothetical protein EDD66_11010 [Mobilisporobacter senegalensis]|uniref:Uncharacterized protein n=1 Tax=Mobilisporobacter senegalensis TaxID=1329262 RepID=A0A3N1XG15_9FIRM|nr:hypothetical protein [Mobilisporobacter senegalensis]ROR25660.1 hypothetical protein EDD66_11010 [Mobilisporobacter senegalensis]
MKIIKNVIKNELRLLGFLVFQEIIRLLMKAGAHLAIDLKQSIIMFIIVAISSVIQQIIKETYIKNHDNRKR